MKNNLKTHAENQSYMGPNFRKIDKKSFSNGSNMLPGLFLDDSLYRDGIDRKGIT